MTQETAQDLLEEYQEIRSRTIKFLEKVPEDKWAWRPHELLGTFGMQVRHMTTSEQSYIEGIKAGKIDFSQKEFDTELETNKEKAIKRLKELDAALVEVVSSIKNPDATITFVDGVAGTSEEPLTKILHYLIEHEFHHQGIFTCYGRIAGMGKFLFM